MPKKKQEMSQVYNLNNEFIFGEKGGKGKNLLSFLKNLSLTGNSNLQLLALPRRAGIEESVLEANSNIYGNLSYGTARQDLGGGEIGHRPSTMGQKPRYNRSLSQQGMSTPPLDGTEDKTSRLSSPVYLSRAVSGSSNPSRKGYRRPTYTDLDDDWDAVIDETEPRGKQKSYLSGSQQPDAFLRENGHQNSDILINTLHPEFPVSSEVDPNAGTNSPRDHGNELRLEAQMKSQNTKFMKFKSILTEDESSVNMRHLKKLSWNGIPRELRALTWQMLLGYLPTNKARQSSTLKRKRQEYLDGLHDANVEALFDGKVTPNNASTSLLPVSSNRDNSANKDKQLNHQIKIDVKRTSPTIKLFGYEATQKSLRKVLYLWAIRHPASGYVQGINDLCTPFYQIFLGHYLWQLQQRKASKSGRGQIPSALIIPGMIDEEGADSCENELLNDPILDTYTWETFDTNRLSSRVTSIIEADTFWCLSKLLDNITDNYIHEQPGIIRQVNDLRNLISKIDNSLLEHLECEGVDFIQFAFRWMNCLLMRELSIELIIRMWDTYLSETPLGFNNFHVYVCAAFLIKFAGELKQRDFQEILLFLQNPPTSSWTEKDVELMLSEAFIWQSLYENASAHLK